MLAIRSESSCLSLLAGKIGEYNPDMHSTPYEDVDSLLKSLLSRMRQTIHERLIGLYLYGSLVTGDFDPGISDIDLLAVTESDITPTESKALSAFHWDFARDNPIWEDRLDIVYLSLPALRDFRFAKSPTVISPGEPFHMREGEALRDWLQNWYIVRDAGVTLFGPPPTEIIPAISQQEFEQAVRNYAFEVSERVLHQPSRKIQAYVILTMCRVLYLLRTGKQTSKRRAAFWACEEFSEWSPLIQSALAWRLAGQEENVDHAATRAETIRVVQFFKELI